jgi:hypothetical protein
MGLFDYFRRRRERESAIPGSSVSGDDAAVTPTSTTAPTPPQQGADVMQQMIALQTLMSQHEVNLTQQPMEVREAVATDLQSRGINAQVGGALQITDLEQIHDVIEVLKNHGLLPPNVNVH